LYSFGSNAQVATKLDVADTRNDNEAPNFYTKGIRADFKNRVNLSIPGIGNYGTTISINPWTNLDNSGNKVHQLHFNDGGLFYRNANPLDAAWGTWRQFLLTNNSGNLDFNGTIFAGPGASTEGQNILSGRYNSGSIVNWGSLWSSGSAFMGFGVRANTASPGGWVSSTPVAVAKSAIATDYFGFHVYGTTNAQSIAEGTAATLSEYFTVRESGNVGIGIGNPESKLDVNGDSFLLSDTRRIYGNNDKNNYYLTHYPVVGSSGLDIHWFGGIKFGTSNGDVMQILQNGYVGIGTTTPAYKLHVVGESYSEGHTIQSYSPQLYLKRNTTNGGYIQGIQTQQLDGTNNWFFGNYYSDRWIVSKGDHQGSKFVVKENGNVGVGVFDPQYKLDVAGKSSFTDNMKVDAKIEAKEIKVTTTPTADFVFEEDYNLPKLEEVEKHIKEKKHLPEIASAKQMEKEGVNVGEFQIKLLQKIEELTLYTIEQNKKIEAQNKQILEQNQRIEKLEKKIKS
jgi:hypothetical protein